MNVSAGSSTTTDSSSGSSSGSSGSGKTVSQMSYVVSGSVSVVRCSDTGAAVSSDSVTDISESDMNSQEAGETDTEQQTEIVALASSDAYFSSDVDGEEDSSGEDTAETSTTLQFAIATEGTSTASSLVIAAPVTGQMPVTSVSATDGSYTGTVAWNPGDGSFQEKTVYQAVVTLTAGDGYVFQAESISQIALGTVSGISVSQDGKSMSFQITFPETAAAEDIKKDIPVMEMIPQLTERVLMITKIMTQIRSRMEQMVSLEQIPQIMEQTVPAETAEQMEIPHRVVTISPEVVLPLETVEVHL